MDAFPDLSFDKPVAIISARLETNRLFVVEQAGRIIAITNLTPPDRTVFLDITERVHEHGESGLLGAAFHPGFTTNGHLFVFYVAMTNSAYGHGLVDTLSRFTLDAGDPD